MYWQLVNDKQGNLIRTVLSKALKNNSNQTINTNTTTNTNNTNTSTNNTSNNTNNSNITNNQTQTNNTVTNSTNNTTTNSSSSQVNPAKNASHVLSMFYCGFGGDYCGQSTINDVSPKSAIVTLAFANTQQNGSIKVD